MAQKTNLVLYMKIGCPYGAAVLDKVAELGLDVEQKITSDPGVREELEKLGGKTRSPFLYDRDGKKGMYESEEINAYLDEHYARKDDQDA